MALSQEMNATVDCPSSFLLSDRRNGVGY